MTSKKCKSNNKCKGKCKGNCDSKCKGNCNSKCKNEMRGFFPFGFGQGRLSE